MTKKDALEQIAHGEVPMRSRWHFTFQAALIIVALIIALAAAIYLASFIFFIIDRDGLLILPRFGWYGFLEFVLALPWAIILLSIILILAAERLSLRFFPIYARPVLFSLTTLLIIVVAASAIIIRTHVHETLENRLPGVRDYYAQFDVPLPTDVYTVIADTESAQSGITAHDATGAVVYVALYPTTNFIGSRDIDPDDVLVILGSRTGNTIEAKSIQILNTLMSWPEKINSEFKEDNWMK